MKTAKDLRMQWNGGISLLVQVEVTSKELKMNCTAWNLNNNSMSSDHNSVCVKANRTTLSAYCLFIYLFIYIEIDPKRSGNLLLREQVYMS